MLNNLLPNAFYALKLQCFPVVLKTDISPMTSLVFSEILQARPENQEQSVCYEHAPLRGDVGHFECLRHFVDQVHQLKCLPFVAMVTCMKSHNDLANQV